MGSIGTEMFRLLQPFDLGRLLALDPYVSQARAAQLGVELVDLPTLFREADFLAINCPLNDETEGMINAELFSLMKPTGLDVFEEEPLPVNHPLTRLDNVILAPHAVAWTDDMYRGNGVGACENVLTVLRGEIPKYTVNREVVERPGFQAKLRALRERWAVLTTDPNI